MNPIIVTLIKFVIARVIGSELTSELKDLLLKTVTDLVNAQFKAKYKDVTTPAGTLTANAQRKIAVKKALAADKTALGIALKKVPSEVISYVIDAVVLIAGKKI